MLFIIFKYIITYYFTHNIFEKMFCSTTKKQKYIGCLFGMMCNTFQLFSEIVIIYNSY